MIVNHLFSIHFCLIRYTGLALIILISNLYCYSAPIKVCILAIRLCHFLLNELCNRHNMVVKFIRFITAEMLFKYSILIAIKMHQLYVLFFLSNSVYFHGKCSVAYKKNKPGHPVNFVGLVGPETYIHGLTTSNPCIHCFTDNYNVNSYKIKFL